MFSDTGLSPERDISSTERDWAIVVWRSYEDTPYTAWIAHILRTVLSIQKIEIELNYNFINVSFPFFLSMSRLNISILLDGKHKKSAGHHIHSTRRSNKHSKNKAVHHGGLVMLLQHWVTGLVLSNETREHGCCHFTLFFCAKVVRLRSSRSVHAEFSVTLLPVRIIYSISI